MNHSAFLIKPMDSIEVKYAYLDSSLEVKNGNKEFYLYFEKVGSDVVSIFDIVYKQDVSKLKKFIQKKDSKKFILIRFQKHFEETKYNVVMVYDSFLHGNSYICLKIIDVEEAITLFSSRRTRDLELRYALSLNSDCIFIYQQSTNIFKLIQFLHNKKNIIIEKDIDEWSQECINNKRVSKKTINNFVEFISALKSCPKDVNYDFECNFRTNNANVLENLNFKGVRFVDDAEFYIVGRITPLKDVTKVKQAKEIIKELQLDPLTKIYNKQTITSYAEKIFEEGKNENVALIIMDLDHFKPINDAFGHLTGDKVLAETGSILQEIVGENGYAGRYGGDEFLLIFFDVKDEIMLRGILHSILIKIRSAFAGRFDDINVTCSLGASVYPKDGTTYDELFKKADFGVYRAKDKGRDRYVFYRKDLHEELYLKAIEAKTGVKYDGRELQELKYLSDFMQDLSSKPIYAIKMILDHMINTYNMDNISIYYGENLEKIYSVGKPLSESDNIDYIHSKAFSTLIGKKPYLRIDFINNLDCCLADFKTAMQTRGIKSSIQCLLGTDNKINGLVMFNRMKEASLWAEYEVNCATMFASCFNLLTDEVKKDLKEFYKSLA